MRSCGRIKLMLCMYEKIWRTLQECGRKLEQSWRVNNDIQPHFTLPYTQEVLSDRKAALWGTGCQ